MLTIVVTLAVTLAVVALTTFILLKKYYLGLSQITETDLEYKHLTEFTWNKYCFYVNKKPILLLSGEFHYWRLPDKSRWKSMLEQYKSSGLNCIRIYFHWGYHIPNDQFIFTENRDIDYLLTICKELELFVLCAPGPYICAETQAGGHPLWLVSDRSIKIRHMTCSFVRQFDSRYSELELDWLKAVLEIIAKHQITKGGTVLAVQIENEYIEDLKGIPVGLSDEMKILCKSARDVGIEVPLFTNDAWEAGSYITEQKSFLGKEKFGVDLYGFDKYVLFAPNSAPLATIIGGGDQKVSNWPEWKVQDLKNGFQKTEDTVRGFGGGAATSPIFIPELQGGWFNHYTVGCTFDDVYNYFGSHLTKTITETAFGQGCTAFNIYMFYGGTNWGTLGDPDVYTSYDYSACIREFGHVSERARLLRLSLGFAQSFGDFVQTDRGSKGFKIYAKMNDFIDVVRTSVEPLGTIFVFFRNLNKQSGTSVVLERNGEEVVLSCKVPYKQSFIGLANYSGVLDVVLSTIPVYAKMVIEKEEVWFVQCDDRVSGQICFKGIVQVENGSMQGVGEVRGANTVVSLHGSKGWVRIRQGSKSMVVIALTGRELLTLTPVFRHDHWYTADVKDNGLVTKGPVAVFWGVYGVLLDHKTGEIKVRQCPDDTKLYCLSNQTFKGFTVDKDYDCGVVSRELKVFNEKPELPVLKFTQTKTMDFNSLEYKKLESKNGMPKLNMIDLCYTGYAVYRMTFETNEIKDLEMSVNVRHRCVLYVNDTVLGGHITYSLQSLRPGAKNGPELFRKAGSQKYKIPKEMVKKGKNVVVCLVESLGLNRCPGTLNDVRNDRGVVEMKVKGCHVEFEIYGKDVRELHEPFNHFGIECGQDWKTFEGDVPKGLTKPTWIKGEFRYDVKGLIAPLRMTMHGDYFAYVKLNGVFIAKYYGKNQGPQHDFYVPEGLIKSVNEVEMMCYGQENGAELKMGLTFWKLDGFMGSGNVCEEGVDFVLKEYIL